MNRKSIIRHLRMNILPYSIAGSVMCLAVVAVGWIIIVNGSPSAMSESSQMVQKKESMQKTSSKNESVASVPSTPEEKKEITEISKPDVINSHDSAVVAPKSSSPSSVEPAPPPPLAPTVQEFGITYVSLRSPAVYCSGGGDYYIAEIGDVDVGLRGSAGGYITYGFEVTGGIPNSWNGYRQPATVPSGIYSTSFNKLYWGNTTEPHMAYAEAIYSGHGVAAVRAVIYTPTLIYSPWVTIPAQQHGEKCS